MRIALVTLGTRGDVVPYLAVARALRARGHEVIFVTHSELAPMVEGAGFALRPMRGGFRELVGTEDGKRWIASADRPLEYAKWAKRLFIPLQEQWLEDSDRGVEGCDAVAFYAIAAHALPAAERRGLPAIALSPWPARPTRALPPIMVPALAALPGWLRLPSWDLVTRLAFSGFKPAFDAHRARVGLPRDDSPTLFHQIVSRGVPLLHLFSEHVIPRPPDWPAHVEVCGFPFATTQGYEPPAALQHFLSDSDPRPIVYAGFGSMAPHSPAALAALAVGAARRAGVRLVYATGWGGAAELAPSDDVHVLEEVPHDWLFPRVAAVVHHGGAGTFAEGLRAGRPTVVVPFFADQPYWAGINERLGTGPARVGRRKATVEKLAAAIRAAVDDPQHRARGARVAEALATEDGPGRAAARIEAIVEAHRRAR